MRRAAGGIRVYTDRVQCVQKVHTLYTVGGAGLYLYLVCELVMLGSSRQDAGSPWNAFPSFGYYCIWVCLQQHRTHASSLVLPDLPLIHVWGQQ